RNDSTSIGMRHDLGPAALTVTSERGRVYMPSLARNLEEPRYWSSSASLDRRFGPASLSFGATRLSEEATVLGGEFSQLFGSGGATSTFFDVSAGVDFGSGW